MAKAPTLPTITGSYASSTQLNAAFRAIEDAFDNTLSRDGSTPNQMDADIDLNSNDLLNAGLVSAESLFLDGVDVTGLAATVNSAANRAVAAADLAEDYADAAEAAAETIGSNAPLFQDLAQSVGFNEAQEALGIGPRRILISANGTYIVKAGDYAPALHFVLLPASGAVTIDCAGLFYNVPYTFVSGTGGTTTTLDFGEDMFVRSPDILPGIATVRSIDLPANQRATVIRLGGNQVFVDFSGPAYESGTWTPSIVGSTTPGTATYAIPQLGRYVRVGNLVTFNAEIRLSSITGATGLVLVTGLPYVARGAGNDVYGVSVPDFLDLTNTPSGGRIYGGTDYIEIRRVNGGSTATMDASFELQNTTRLLVDGKYVI